MNAPSIDIKDLMVLEGTWEFGTDLFIGTQPTTPMNCTTIFDTSTNPPDGTVSGNKVFLHESLMMWVRNSSYEAAYLEAQAIISILHNKARFTLSSTYYLYANLQSGPNTLTEGGEDYSEFSINFELLRKSGIAASSSFLTFADLVTDLVAGTNITLTVDETEETITIASTAITTVSWGDLGGNIEDQDDLVAALLAKVDKVTGKELSSNDYTDTEKTKLSNIADGAEVNVNADWDSSSGDSEILNKPTIPTGGLVGTKEVDETDIADDKIIVYDSASGKYVLQVKPTGGGSSDVLQTLAYASTVVPNLALGNIITITLTGNIIIANPTGYTGIGKVEFIFIQGGTGGYTATFGTSYKQVVAPELNGNIGGKNYVEYYAYSETDIVLKNIVSL